MATAAAKKPSAPKLNAKPPAGKGKPAAAPKAAAPPKPAKEQPPMEEGQIVIFKGYAQEPPEGTVKIAEGTELAVVGQRIEEGVTFVACVDVGDYHTYMADPESPTAPDGNEFTLTEIKRTNKRVEEPFALVAIGEYENIVAENPDKLDRAQHLVNNAAKSFFYLGGTFAELWKGRNDEGAPFFTEYARPDGAEAPADPQSITAEGGYAPDKEGFILFLADYFPTVGGIRKVLELIGVYETFSALPNAGELVAQLATIGWWKAGMIRSHITEENAAEIVQEAADNTVPKLQALIKEKYVTEDGKNAAGRQATRVTIKRTDYKFQLFEDRGTGITMILELARKQLNITDDNALFEHIVSEWAGQFLGQAAVDKANAATAKKLAALKSANVNLPESHPNYEAPAPKAAAETPAAAPAKPAPQPARGKLPQRPKPVAQPAA